MDVGDLGLPDSWRCLTASVQKWMPLSLQLSVLSCLLQRLEEVGLQVPLEERSSVYRILLLDSSVTVSEPSCWLHFETNLRLRGLTRIPFLKHWNSEFVFAMGVIILMAQIKGTDQLSVRERHFLTTPVPFQKVTEIIQSGNPDALKLFGRSDQKSLEYRKKRAQVLPQTTWLHFIGCQSRCSKSIHPCPMPLK